MVITEETSDLNSGISIQVHTQKGDKLTQSQTENTLSTFFIVLKGNESLYLEQAIFREITERTSFEEESMLNNLANASKVDASEGTSKQRELKQYVVMHATLFFKGIFLSANPCVFRQNEEKQKNN